MSSLVRIRTRFRFQSALVALSRRSYSTKPSSPPKDISVSACAPNTILTGIAYLKDQPPVLALPDDEYPPWLWSLLKPKVLDDSIGSVGEKKRHRKENRQRIREANFLKTQ